MTPVAPLQPSSIQTKVKSPIQPSTAHQQEKKKGGDEARPIIIQKLNLLHLFPGKKDAFAIVLDNVFTQAECDELIEMSENVGYDEALVGGAQVRQEQQRNNWRYILFTMSA